MIKLFLFCLWLSVATLSAQTTTWQTSLQDTYVYKLSDKEAETLFLSPDRTHEIIYKLIERPCYTTFRDKWEFPPETGHFLLFNIQGNRVHFNYKSFIPYQVILLPVYDAFTVQVIDEKGKPRRDASITFIDKDTKARHRLQYDSQTKTYSIPLKKSEDFLLITELDKVRSYFDGDTREAPEKREYDDDDSISEYPRIYSYLITDKYTYKPGDTVRVKSYILSGVNKPFKKNVTLQVGESRSFKDVTTIAPHRPGSFTGEFVLDNTLKLKLDKPYEIRMVDEKGVILAATRFEYEDYQLFDYNLTVDIGEQNHFFPDTNTIRIHATDVNNLPLLDTQIDVTVLRKKISFLYGGGHYSLPDTILHKTITTDQRPSTITLPGELFGKADLTYQVKVEATMPDYRKRTEVKDIHFHYHHKKLAYTIQDSLFVFDYQERGKSVPVPAILKHNSWGTPQTVQLPHTEPFNPDIYRYIVTTDKLSEPVELKTEQMVDLKIKAGITDGFFHASLHNPLGIETSWYIYSGEELVKKGSGQQIKYQTRLRDNEENWYVDLFYRLDDEVKQLREEIIPLNKKLRITTDLPERIYPGQEVETTITVKDIKGKPVKNVDITAFAVNGLMNEEFAPLPYYGEIFGDREEKDSYKISKVEAGNTLHIKDTYYHSWEKIGGLDTLPFYRFLYPEKGEFFIHTEDAPESITQFAPFVSWNGNLIQVHVVEVDDVPVWFSWTSNVKSYSFPIDPDKEHTIKLRIDDRKIVIQTQKGFFKPGMKTIFSLRDTSGKYQGANYSWQVKPENNSPGKEEKNYYQQYISEIPVWANTYYTYLKQGETEIPVAVGEASSKRQILVGPVSPGMLNYNGYIEYEHEGGYRYDYKDNSVYKYPDSNNKFVPGYFYEHKISYPYNLLHDVYISPDSISKLKQKPIEHQAEEKKDFISTRRFIISQDNMDVIITLAPQTNNSLQKVIAIPKNDTIQDESFSTTKLHGGLYDLVILYENGEYIRKDSIELLPWHYHLLQLHEEELQKGEQPESLFHIFSDNKKDVRQIVPATTPVKKEKEKTKRPEIPHYREIRNAERSRGYGRMSYYLPPPDTYSYGMQDTFSYIVTGEVYDQDGEPIIGASVVIKGTQHGCITDFDGKFNLVVPSSFGSDDIWLWISYIGYREKDVKVQPGSHIRIILEEDANILEEMVIRGYGGSYGSSYSSESQEKKEKQIPSSAKLPVEEEEEGLDMEAEKMLYYELSTLNRLRSNFSDVGFWQPRLYTDRKGEATFTTTFPDNLTRWDAVIYAMNPKLQTGTHTASIRSYKPLMAGLQTPAFLLEGDTAYLESIVRDYTGQEEQAGTIRMTVGNDTLVAKPLQFRTVHQEKFPLYAASQDTITTSFVYQNADGYMDGEEREIPVNRLGIPIKKEHLAILIPGDTTLIKRHEEEISTLSMDVKSINLHLDLAGYLAGYEYACNEQLASKLTGLLTIRKICELKGEPFTNDDIIEKIIERLLHNQNHAGLWGWWNNAYEAVPWMSCHIMTALKLAADEGFVVNPRKPFPYLYTIDSGRYTTLTDNIELLYASTLWEVPGRLEDKIQQFENQLTELEKKDNFRHARERLILLEIKKKAGLPYTYDEVTSYSKNNIRGDHETMIAYRILQGQDSLKQTKMRLQPALLDIAGKYGNTYWKARSLISIYPDLEEILSEKDSNTLITLTGRTTQEITELPQVYHMKEREVSLIHQQGPALYVTATHKSITTRETIEGPFTVRTWFAEGDTLQQGVPVDLNVEVNIKNGNSNYLMIEIPIPAGCVYESKPNNLWGETHREYFKEKTVIFLEHPRTGKLRFTIPLLPYFEGVYHMNPAKVEKMYTPTEFSTNEMRKVTILK